MRSSTDLPLRGPARDAAGKGHPRGPRGHRLPRGTGPERVPHRPGFPRGSGIAAAVGACGACAGESRPRHPGHAILLLALFLLLAGLFAVLLSYARLDETRAARVLASLESRFAAAAALSAASGLEPGGEVAGASRKPSLAPENPLPGRRSPPGTVVLALPERRLFTEAGAVPRARWLSLGRLARLAREEGGWIEVAAPWPGDAAEFRLRTLRLRALAAVLRELGAPRAGLALGFGARPAPLWQLVYRPPLDHGRQGP